MTRKVTSMSFRTRAWRKGTVWSEKETELFYGKISYRFLPLLCLIFFCTEILRCTGPDFGLMHEFFPTRARNELKSKYNREERANWDKLKEVRVNMLGRLVTSNITECLGDEQASST